MRRRLVLKRETLADLSSDDLAHVAGAAPPTPPCATWLCEIHVTWQTCAVSCVGCQPTLPCLTYPPCVTDKCG